MNPALEDLLVEFGSIDYRSDPIPFHFTDYYFEEMGEPLYRCFISFEKLFDSASFASIKVTTNSLEEKYTGMAGSRVLNLDPGYLTAAAYIISTSKNYAHRIYLGLGVFAQQELLFERKRIITLDWTYPDYRSFEYQEILRKIRRKYLQQLRGGSDHP
ncbi:DUF4416 family protein [bacterium]|nr:DUF4416 family protein [bacterium]